MATTALSEGIVWATTYRTTKYKGMKADLEKGAKKLEKMKEEILTKNDVKIAKKIEREEERLKAASKDLQACKSKSMIVIAIMTISIMTMLNKYYSGMIVAKLPFEPFGFIRGIAHRNLEGEDFTDCSFIFLYILCNMSLRSSFQKLCGFNTSRAVDKLATQQFNKQFEPTDQKNK